MGPQDHQLVLSQAWPELWASCWVKACCLATDTQQPSLLLPIPPSASSWKPSLLRWVSSAGRDKCFSLRHSSLPQGAWLPGAQTLQWARPSLDHTPSLDDMHASFSSSWGTPGTNRHFQMQSWWAQRGDRVTAFGRVGISVCSFLPSFSLAFP